MQGGLPKAWAQVECLGASKYIFQGYDIRRLQNGQVLEFTTAFKYLGSFVQNDVSQDKELNRRFGLAAMTFGKLKSMVFISKNDRQKKDCLVLAQRHGKYKQHATFTPKFVWSNSIISISTVYMYTAKAQTHYILK